MGRLISKPNPDDLNGICHAIAKLDKHLNTGAAPTFTGIGLTGLTASRLVATDASKKFASVADLSAWIAGTANQVVVSNDSDGSITLSTPQDIHTGASPTFAGGTFTGNVTLVDTTTATTGVIYKGTDRFIHNFHHPTGNGAVPDGRNTFIGVNAGNFTMGSTATLTHHGSYNTGIGYQALQSLVTGWHNIAIGSYALNSTTSADSCIAIGHNALYSNTYNDNSIAIGPNALYSSLAGYSNFAIGRDALYANTSGHENFAIGRDALKNNIGGSYNFAFGQSALRDNTTGDGNVGIGRAVIIMNETGDYNTAIGYRADGYGGGAGNSHSNNTMIGAYSGYNITTGSANIFIGYKAGYRQSTLSNLFIVDRVLANGDPRADVAAELANSILYGVMADAAADQTLRINAAVTVSGTFASGVITQSGTTLANTYQPLDAELTSLAALSYVSASFVKMTGANTFALRTIGETADDLETTIDHANLANLTIAAHDTTATGANLTSLTDDSMVDALHRHSELSASDGTPNPALSVDADGNVGIGLVVPNEQLEIGTGTGGRLLVSDGGGANRKGFLFNAPGTNAYGRLLTYDYGGTTGVELRINDQGGRVSIGFAPANLATALTIGGTLSLKEQVAADGDIAAYGQIWVKNDGPNILMFTDDAGTDFTVNVTPI